jgi:hypothetical protein
MRDENWWRQRANVALEMVRDVTCTQVVFPDEKSAMEYMRKTFETEPIVALKAFRYVCNDVLAPARALRADLYTARHVYRVIDPKLVECKNGYHACASYDDLALFLRDGGYQVRRVVLGGAYIRHASSKIIAECMYIGDTVSGTATGVVSLPSDIDAVVNWEVTADSASPYNFWISTDDED